MNIFKRLFDHEYKELKKFSALADKIEALDEEYQKLSDYELKAKTDEFKRRLKEGETLDDILPEAYATVREAAYRVIGLKPFYVHNDDGSYTKEVKKMFQEWGNINVAI